MTDGRSVGSSGAGRSEAGPRAFRHGDSSFQGKFDALLHRRLFLANALWCVVGSLALAASIVTYFLARDSIPTSFFGPRRLGIFCIVAIGAALLLLLRKTKLSGKTLHGVDAATFAVGALGPMALFALSYEDGAGAVLNFVVIAILGRAVFVPSRALRTFVLSATAPIALFALETAHGEAWYARDVRVQLFGVYVIWDQVVLWLSVFLATYASHANFSLRLQAYQATRVGQYELEEKIGEGAMGEVWRARHGLLRRPTAVKLIRAEIADERTRKRFEHEVRQTCRLSHPNVVAIYDYGHTEDGVFFYAMELVDGEDLGTILRDSGPMPPARVVHVLVQVCEALAEAHAASLVHRDVKPANLMLCRRGLTYDVVKVMDFGLVKDTDARDPGLTGAGEACGTPETISPEAALGRAVGPAADLYSVGAVGCMLLTGRPVFDAATAIELVIAHAMSEPIPPSARVAGVPDDLEAVLLRCLRKNAAERPASALELRDALAACRDAGRWKQSDAAAWWAARRPAATEAVAAASG